MKSAGQQKAPRRGAPNISFVSSAHSQLKSIANEIIKEGE